MKENLGLLEFSGCGKCNICNNKCVLYKFEKWEDKKAVCTQCFCEWLRKNKTIEVFYDGGGK